MNTKYLKPGQEREVFEANASNYELLAIQQEAEIAGLEASGLTDDATAAEIRERQRQLKIAQAKAEAFGKRLAALPNAPAKE